MVRVRIIPATITIALLLLGVKITDITRGTEALAEQTNPPSPTTNIAPKSEDKATESAAAPAAENKDAASPDATKESPAADAKDAAPASPAEKEKTESDKKAESGKKEDAKAEKKGEGEKKNAAVSESAGSIVDHRYTPVEVELLQNLVRRREELDRWEKNIGIKEAALSATEKRVDDKIAQIEAMKREVTELLAAYNEKEDAKIRSLVKIYESMKPKDAARIFDEVEMPILLLVIDRMSEKKAAPILAEMDSKKAKQITVQLAEQRKVSTAKLNVPATSSLPTQ